MRYLSFDNCGHPWDNAVWCTTDTSMLLYSMLSWPGPGVGNIVIDNEVKIGAWVYVSCLQTVGKLSSLLQSLVSHTKCIFSFSWTVVKGINAIQTYSRSSLLIIQAPGVGPDNWAEVNDCSDAAFNVLCCVGKRVQICWTSIHHVGVRPSYPTAYTTARLQGRDPSKRHHNVKDNDWFLSIHILIYAQVLNTVWASLVM